MLAVLYRFSGLDELVHPKEPPMMGLEQAMDYVCHAVWGMLFTDDACIVLSSHRGLAMLMQAIVEVCRVFTLPVSENNRESMCVNLHWVHLRR